MPEYIIHRWLHSQVRIEADTPGEALALSEERLDSAIGTIPCLSDMENVWVCNCLVSRHDWLADAYRDRHIILETVAN